jgi:hypothetical protein
MYILNIHEEEVMKPNRFPILIAAILISTLILPACSGNKATPTPLPFTDTPVPTATKTPRPTATLEPTPAPLGSPVKYESLEITVLDAFNRETVHFGDISGKWETFYKPSEGHYLIDVGVLVRNLEPGNAVPMRWKYIYIVEQNGDSWYPGWGKAKTVDTGTKVDPFRIGLSSDQLQAGDLVEFDNDTYLRLIFGVVDDPEQTILFRIENSPPIGFKFH